MNEILLSHRYITGSEIRNFFNILPPNTDSKRLLDMMNGIIEKETTPTSNDTERLVLSEMGALFFTELALWEDGMWDKDEYGIDGANAIQKVVKLNLSKITMRKYNYILTEQTKKKAYSNSERLLNSRFYRYITSTLQDFGDIQSSEQNTILDMFLYVEHAIPVMAILGMWLQNYDSNKDNIQNVIQSTSVGIIRQWYNANRPVSLPEPIPDDKESLVNYTKLTTELITVSHYISGPENRNIFKKQTADATEAELEELVDMIIDHDHSEMSADSDHVQLSPYTSIFLIELAVWEDEMWSQPQFSYAGHKGNTIDAMVRSKLYTILTRKRGEWLSKQTKKYRDESQGFLNYRSQRTLTSFFDDVSNGEPLKKAFILNLYDKILTDFRERENYIPIIDMFGQWVKNYDVNKDNVQAIITPDVVVGVRDWYNANK